MALPRVHPFVPFNHGSPLNLIQHDDIPAAALKSLPFFTGEDQTTTIEHIRDVASLCGVHHIIVENVVLRLLAAPFKGKALQWFRGLPVNSKDTSNELG